MSDDSSATEQNVVKKYIHKSDNKDNESLENFIKCLSVFGWGFIALVGSKFLYIIVPLDFSNPEWSMHTIGQFVEISWLIMIGLLLIFIQFQTTVDDRTVLRITILRFIILLVGIIYLIFIPLLGRNIEQYYRQLASDFFTNIDREKSDFIGIIEIVKSSQSIEDLHVLIDRYKYPSNDIFALENIGTMKHYLSRYLATNHNNKLLVINHNQRNKKIKLLKNSMGWCMGSFISGVILIAFWYRTKWILEFLADIQKKFKVKNDQRDQRERRRNHSSSNDSQVSNSDEESHHRRRRRRRRSSSDEEDESNIESPEKESSEDIRTIIGEERISTIVNQNNDDAPKEYRKRRRKSPSNEDDKDDLKSPDTESIDDIKSEVIEKKQNSPESEESDQFQREYRKGKRRSSTDKSDSEEKSTDKSLSPEDEAFEIEWRKRRKRR